MAHKQSHRFAERKENLASEGMEVVGWSCEVAHKPVDLVQLLHLKVLILWLHSHSLL